MTRTKENARLYNYRIEYQSSRSTLCKWMLEDGTEQNEPMENLLVKSNRISQASSFLIHERSLFVSFFNFFIPIIFLAVFVVLQRGGIGFVSGFSVSNVQERHLGPLNMDWRYSHQRSCSIGRRQRLRSLSTDNETQSNYEMKNDPSIHSASYASNILSKSLTLQSKEHKSRFVATTNPIDLLLTWIVSDMGSIIVGLMGLIILLTNGILFPIDINGGGESIGQETRNNLLTVFAFLSILLNGLTKIDIESRVAKRVLLQGIFVDDIVCSEKQQCDCLDWNYLDWVLRSILEATPAKTAVLIQYRLSNVTSLHDPIDLCNGSWDVRAITGIVSTKLASAVVTSTAPTEGKALKLSAGGSNILPANTPILNRFLQRRDNPTDETYFPTLQALPGRVELTSSSLLPPNTESVLIIPIVPTILHPIDIEAISTDGDENRTCIRGRTNKHDATSPKLLLILGSDLARSFTPRDIAWCQAVSTRIPIVS